ncbi:unnamed protein product, partial [Brenthis ino]
MGTHFLFKAAIRTPIIALEKAKDITTPHRMDYAVLPLGGKKSVVLFQNYSYSFHMKGARKLQCSRKVSMQCGAYLKMDKDKRIIYADTYHTHPPTLYQRPFEFLESSRGGLVLLMQGHTFVKMNKSAHNWYCSRRISRKCRAKVRVNEEELFYEYIRVVKMKKPLLLLRKYTFAQTTSDCRYWNCSKKFGQERCPARLRFDNNGTLVYYNLEHNHSPPTFFKQRDGQYVRLK